MVSLYVVPDDSEIESLFPNADIIKTNSEFYDKEQPPFLNSLQTIEAGEAYLIKSSINESITIKGDLCSISQTELAEGWNLLGVPLNADFDIDLLPTDTYIVKTFDEYYQEGDEFNNLTKLSPGKGYFIKVKEDCTVNWSFY